MDGRVYDPSVGRFLSPDNEIQAPDNSQSYNRYAYCMNNPLKYTDPTGYLWYRDNFGNWNYWAEPGCISDEDVDPNKLKEGEDFTFAITDRVLVCGFWSNGRFNLTDPFSKFPLYAATLTKEGRKKQEAEKKAAEADAKDKTKTKTVVEKRKEDVERLKAKNGGSRSVHWHDEKYGLGKLFGPGRSDMSNKGQSWEDGKKTMLATGSIIATAGTMAIAGGVLTNTLGTASIINSIDNITGASGNINNQSVQLGIQLYKTAIDATSVMTNLRPDNFIKGSSLILDGNSTYNHFLNLNK
jgi:hypothetical protein